MIVVADTSPINYLILIDQIAILEVLHGRILIPHAVHEELLSLKAPASVRAWAKNPPYWLESSPHRPDCIHQLQDWIAAKPKPSR